MTNSEYTKGIKIIKDSLSAIPTAWDGKESVLAMKERNYQWKQMEWIGFYFELLCNELLENAGFEIPGETYGNTEFDSFFGINWDMKASAIKSDNHRVVLNDQSAIDTSIQNHGNHGIILALLDVDYNDDDRSFQKWHTELKGGLSKYEEKRIKRNATSRYRKTRATVEQILLLSISAKNRGELSTYNQGRNAGGEPRRPKYMIDTERAGCFEVGRIDFP